MKTNGLLDRNLRKGSLGEAMHALRCRAGHNLRMILVHLRVVYCALVGQLVPASMLITGGMSPGPASLRA